MSVIEVWRPVVGHEGAYEVSDLGKVRSVARIQSRRRGHTVYAYPVHAQLLTPSPEGGGTGMRVTLGKGAARKVHHLVLEAFVGPRPDGCEGLHADDNPAHNALPNLSWGTHLQNMADAAARGRTARGERNGNAVLTEALVLEIDALLPTKTDTEIADLHGLRRETVKNIRRRDRWRYLLGDSAPGNAQRELDRRQAARAA